MVAFSKPSTELPAAIQLVLNPLVNSKSSQTNTRSRVLASAAILSLAAYTTNYFYQKHRASSELVNRSSSTQNHHPQTAPAESASAIKKYTITIPYKNRTASVTICPTKPGTFEKHKRFFTPLHDSSQPVGVNRTFFTQLKAILKILIPRLRSKEAFILLLHSIFLLLRTYLSIVVARVDGRIVRDLVAANGKEFVKGLGYWFAIAIPAVYTNSMIRYLQSKLSIAFRTRLTRYVHDLYLDEKNAYYKVINLDNRIDGPDQFITTDISRFCDGLASLYSNLGKPILDTIIFNYALTKSIGLAGMLGIFSNYVITARLLRNVTPAFGKLAAIEAKLEGDFRATHSRLITNAEEIAFYNGAPLEHSILNRTYTRLIKHINSILKIRIAYNMFEDFVIKYFWSTVGLLMCALPVFYPEWGGRGGRTELEGGIAPEGKERDRTKAFITNKRIMLTLADAGGRMMLSYKELAELAGYTSRVFNLLSVLHMLHANQYVTTPRSSSFPADKIFYSLGDIRGSVIYGFNGLKFENVPIVIPKPGNPQGGEELISGLNLTLKPGEHLLITGPNGVGKTSIARVISTLWPIFRGTLSRPHIGDIFYIPQRPYLSIGTFRDQLIYPHSHADMVRDHRTDEELLNILDLVHLKNVLNREGGWETKKEWKDVFSGGEKQRIGICRLFYHNPKFAILDECTSAVSTDVEGLMYQHAKDVGITLITISHRPALTKYHTHLLRVTGESDFGDITTIGTPEERMSLDREVSALEEKIKDVEAMENRLAEINRELQLGISNEDTRIRKRGLGTEISKNMVRLAVYGGISSFLAISVVAAAFRQRSNFYAACIYLSKSSACMMILMNMGFFLMIVFGQILQSIFFGQLRAVEIEHLYERAWYAVTETCLAMTIFRDEFDTRFFVTFTTLLFLKIFHWLCQDRVEFMEQSLAVPMSFHVRMVALMEILCAVDALLVLHAVDVTMKKGPNMMIMFAFEYSILGATIISTFCKYILNVIDMRREEPWENKSIYVFYLELVTDFFKLITYLIFFAIILIFYGLPLHIIRDVYVTLRSFLQKCGEFVRYRRATRNMNERYPNATPEELERLSDRTCIICREEMIAAAMAFDAINNNPPEAAAGRPNRRQVNTGSSDTPKKLPCGHIFHFHCLRSWLERQQSCPTCRRPVLSETQPQQQAARPIPIPRNGPQQAPAPPPPMHGMPLLANPFQGYIGNPMPGLMMFPPPPMQVPWMGAPIPIPNANDRNGNLQPNGDHAPDSSAPQQISTNIGEPPTTDQVEASTSSSQSQSSNSTRQQPSIALPSLTSTRDTSNSSSTLTQPQISLSSNFPPSTQSPPPVQNAPPFHQYHSQYTLDGLIPLISLPPFRNPGLGDFTTGDSSISLTSLNNLSEEQIRMLQSNTREALVERLRILQSASGQIFDIITLLTQTLSALPQVPQENQSPHGNLETEISSVNNNSGQASSLEKDKKGKGKSVTISDEDFTNLDHSETDPPE
ncbi:hypothetical protein G9A89_014634 [Geosiphon pyriformis]|nr:hypothetical protein G9A89_014634 [Geosiphon pyriformis]